MKIGIYPGTFDPIHDGHIEFAKSALTQAKLSKVIIVAEKEPYRKRPHASWDHRQAMIERATEGLEAVDHDYQFANQLAHKHTMQDMLNVAKKHYEKESEIWFLVGSDIFEHMGEWKDMVHADNYGGFVVALKNDHTQAWLKAKIEQLSGQGFVLNTVLVSHTKNRASSSKIREGLSQKKILLDDAHPNVVEYIREHDLYQDTSGGSSKLES